MDKRELRTYHEPEHPLLKPYGYIIFDREDQRYIQAIRHVTQQIEERTPGIFVLRELPLPENPSQSTNSYIPVPTEIDTVIEVRCLSEKHFFDLDAQINEQIRLLLTSPNEADS